MAPILQFSRLGARWPGESDTAFSGLDLNIECGDRVVIEGASGSGKTTLAHVLVRFLDYSGSYRIGGVESRELPADAVRGIVGLCEQSPYLFDEDIRQNLMFAHNSATDEELVAVLARSVSPSGCASAAACPPASAMTVRSSRVARLSAWLSRALLADFPVIVFDEPTANVDPERAAGLMRDILAAATGAQGEDSRTVIVKIGRAHV